MTAVATHDDLDALERRIQAALAPLQLHSHEPQDIRPRVLDALLEFGMITFDRLSEEDVLAVTALRVRQRLEAASAGVGARMEGKITAAGALKLSDIGNG